MHMATPQAVVILLSLLFASLCVHVCVCLLVVLSQPDVLDHVDVSAVSSFTFTLCGGGSPPPACPATIFLSVVAAGCGNQAMAADAIAVTLPM
jgi:hypothetical protein